VKKILIRVPVTGILLAALLALVLPAAASAGTQVRHHFHAVAATTSVTATSVQLTKDEQLLVTLINQQRAKAGLKPVTVHTKLVAAARGHAVEMATKKYFRHDSYNGEHFDARIMRYGYSMSGYTYWRAGEDIYWGASLFSSPVAAVNAWMASSLHRAVILGANFRDIGVGTGFCSSFGGQSNVTFYTLDMGRRY
jgi:uncharacterized protein YkwD